MNREIVIAAMLWTVLLPAAATAQFEQKVPMQLEGVGVIEHLDAQIPLDLVFTDSSGKETTLGEYFDGEHPVILTLNYSNCPMLCSLQLNGLFEGLKKVKWDMGDEYQMVTVSIDPLEIPERAKMSQRKYLKLYGRKGSAGGYHCLTGDEKDIKRLAESVGFGYVQDPDTGQYLHVAVAFVCMPDGRVSHYLYGVKFNSQTLRLSLLEASRGEIGTTVDQVWLYCFQYDASAGKYSLSAVRLMKAGGGLMIVVLGGVLLFYWRREAKKPSIGNPVGAS